MNTKSLPMVSMLMVLVAAVAVSYLITRPNVFIKQQAVPMFMGEELTVQKAGDKVVTTVKAKPAVQEVKISKVISQPAPQPKVAAPLPIIPPSISYRVMPQYPMTALEQGLEGVVLLAIYVGMNGAAEQVQVKTSSGVSELDASAVAAVSQWKFSPATQGGQALASWFELPVRFEVQ